MNSSRERWIDGNQRYLAAEFARLKALLGGREAGSPMAQDQAGLANPAAIDDLTDIFALTLFERDLLLLCAGVEMDAELAAACAARNADRPFATLGLALAVLPDAHWSAIVPSRPLRLFRLIEVIGEQALTTAPLRIDERLLHHLVGIDYIEPRLRPLLRPQSPPAAMAKTHANVVDVAVRVVEPQKGKALVQLVGDDTAGQRDVACAVAGQLGLKSQVLRAGDIPGSPHEAEALSVLWFRESLLLRSALIIDCSEGGETAAVIRFVETTGGLVFISARQSLAVERPSLQYPVDKPSAPEQRRLWREALGPAARHLNGAFDGVSTQFRLSARTIVQTGNSLRKTLKQSSDAGAALWQACRASSKGRLDELAQRVDARASWDDLVLPEAQKSVLRQVAVQVRHRLAVYEDWGFADKSALGLGISALFAGESGTGKTMAAEVLANTLHLDLYRIDLATTVSKYIGETEKNLRRLFDAADDCGAILLFDEADALFGKRGEVNDGLDRYANIEVSYLLQRMEAYRGLAILTTNQRYALDTAFQRRLRFIVQFPFPDHAQREQIWQHVFPARAPLGDLDRAKLARLSVSGGSIRNIALGAAFLAAEDNQPIGMAHLLQAARGEAAKRERPLADAETRGWV